MTDPKHIDATERDDFLEAMLPVLAGECMKRDAGWCSVHESAWLRRRDHCDRYSDLDDFADSILEAWQGRPSAAMLDALTRHGVLTDKVVAHGATATYAYDLHQYVSEEREVITWQQEVAQ